MKRTSSHLPPTTQMCKHSRALVLSNGLIVGVDVVIHGLMNENSKKYNQAVGNTVAYNPTRGRWQVQLRVKDIHRRWVNIYARAENVRRVENVHLAVLKELNTNTNMNGQSTQIVAYDESQSLWQVKCQGHTLMVRPECLVLVRGTQVPPHESTQLLLEMYPRSDPNNFSARSFFITINNPTAHCYACLNSVVALRLVASRERGKTNGVLHLHCIVVFTRTKRRKAVCQLFGGRAWVQALIGKFQDVRKYVTKDGDVLRDDDFSQQGRRNDLHTFVTAVRDGMTDQELVENFPVQVAKYFKCISFIRGTIPVLPLPLGSKRKIGLWIWSAEPNVGKTTYVHNRWPDLYNKTCDKWWPSYFGEREVLIDDPHPDFRTDFMAKIKSEWCSERVFYGEGKGFHMSIRFTHLIVCANQSPRDYFRKKIWDTDGPMFNARFTVAEVEKRADLHAIVFPPP